MDAKNKEINRIKNKLQILIEDQKSQNRDPNIWLLEIYRAYHQRFLYVNELIYKTGAIMIPLSFSAFAVYFSLNRPSTFYLATIMFASVLIYFTWLIFAENQRAFQEKAESWIMAIHKILKLDEIDIPAKVRGSGLPRLLTFNRAIQKMRWFLLFIIVLGWVLILLFV